MDNLVQPSTATLRGARDSLVQGFGIKGLYGYRSIQLESAYAATILIAKNGTGKTTLLGALDAFLRLQFSRLRNLEFEEIHCKLRNVDSELVLTHEQVIEFLQIPVEGDIPRIASRANIDPNKLFHFLLEEYSPSLPINDYTDSEIYRSIASTTNYNYQEARAICEKLRRGIYDQQPNIARISAAILSALDGFDVVYLPTYRRVELALVDDSREPPYRRKRRPKFNVAAGSLFTGDIQFGLSDISERLHELNQQIIFESNNGYRKISANIINDLIDGSFEKDEDGDQELPTEDELKLFFSRLEQGRRIGPYPAVSIPNIDRIYSEDALPESSRKFLRYFLRQLSTVIVTSKAVEAPVDGFIESCNKYLLSQEPSTFRDQESLAGGASGKALQLNRRNLRVNVASVPEGRKISLDALSSGEKQMISLFAKLFLYPNKKIVLIDEPELSLSIDWQKQILVDVLSAPLCEQVVAITHSPFVFDNDLEPFAKSIKVTSDVKHDQTLFPMEDEDHIDE